MTDYYFANHQLRIIFFLDHFSSDRIPNWEVVYGVSSGRHLRMSSLCHLLLEWFVLTAFTFAGHEIEAQYWYELAGSNHLFNLFELIASGHRWHCLSYPSALQLTNDIVCEFRATVMHFIGG